MKYLYLIAAILIAGCDQEASNCESKTIIDKQAPIEQRYDWLDDGRKSTTIYYLVADDGTVCEVPLGTYSTAAIGSSFCSYNWTTR